METNNEEKVILDDYQFDFLFLGKYLCLTNELIKKIEAETKRRGKGTTKESAWMYQCISDASKSIYTANNILFKSYTPQMMTDLENRCDGIEEINEYLYCMTSEFKDKLIEKAKEYYEINHTGVESPKLKSFAEKYRLSKKAIEELKTIL